MNNIKNRVIGFSIEAQRFSTAEMLAARQDHHPTLRLALVGAYKAIGKVIVPAMGRQVGGKYFASGFEQLAFRNTDGDIIKLLYNTIGSSEEEAQNAAQKYQQLSDQAQVHLGDHWVETTFYPTSLPKLVGGFAVAAVQPEITPVARFESPSEVSTYSTEPWYRHLVGGFSDRINSFYVETGLYPDLLGTGNVLLAGSPNLTLKIVDTLPETPDKLDWTSADDLLTRREVHADLVRSWGQFSRTTTKPYESATLSLR